MTVVPVVFLVSVGLSLWGFGDCYSSASRVLGVVVSVVTVVSVVPLVSLVSLESATPEALQTLWSPKHHKDQ